MIGAGWAAMLAMPFTFVTNALQGYGHMGAYLGPFLEPSVSLSDCGCHLRWNCPESGGFSSERYDDCGWYPADCRCAVCSIIKDKK